MQAFNIFQVVCFSVVLPGTGFQIFDLHIEFLAGAVLAVHFAIAVVGSEETTHAVWDSVAFEDGLEFEILCEVCEDAFVASYSADRSALSTKDRS